MATRSSRPPRPRQSMPPPGCRSGSPRRGSVATGRSRSGRSVIRPPQARVPAPVLGLSGRRADTSVIRARARSRGVVGVAERPDHEHPGPRRPGELGTSGQADDLGAANLVADQVSDRGRRIHDQVARPGLGGHVLDQRRHVHPLGGLRRSPGQPPPGPARPLRPRRTRRPAAGLRRPWRLDRGRWRSWGGRWRSTPGRTRGFRGAPATWATRRAANGVTASTTSSRPRRDHARTVRAKVARMASGHNASSRDVTSRGCRPARH